MTERLAGEIIAASKGEGASVKKKMTPTEWQMPTRHSLTSGCNRPVSMKFSLQFVGAFFMSNYWVL